MTLIPPVNRVYRTVYTSTADHSVSNTMTETSLINGPADAVDGGATIPAGWLMPGRSIQLIMRGNYTMVALLPTLTLRFKMGSTTVATAGVSALAAASNNKGFLISLTMTCRTAGTTGTMAVAGDVGLNLNTGLRTFYEINNVTDATIDTTVSQPLEVTAQWSAIGANAFVVKVATISLLQN